MASPLRLALASALALPLAVCAPSTAPAFVSPCAALGHPEDWPECPVMDIPHNAQEQPRVDVEKQILDKHTDDVKQENAQLAATGSQGSSGQGGPQAGGDLTGGQTMTPPSSSASAIEGQATQFYFGDNSQFKDDTLNGTKPSNYTAAAAESGSSDIADTIFALAAKKQTEKDSQEVTQLAQQAGSTQNMHQDMGFANKVRAKLVEVLMLRAALEARLVEIRSKNVAFHMTSDQSPDTATGNLNSSSTSSSSGTSGVTQTPAGQVETTTAPTASPVVGSTAPASQASTIASNAAAAGAATQAAVAAAGATPASSATATPATASQAPSALAATQGLLAAVGAASADPGASAAAIEKAYDGAPGDSADKIRQVSLSLAISPSAFGISGATDQTAVVTALAAYATSR